MVEGYPYSIYTEGASYIREHIERVPDTAVILHSFAPTFID